MSEESKLNAVRLEPGYIVQQALACIPAPDHADADGRAPTMLPTAEPTVTPEMVAAGNAASILSGELPPSSLGRIYRVMRVTALPRAPESLGPHLTALRGLP